jgi:hypothetical protein
MSEHQCDSDDDELVELSFILEFTSDGKVSLNQTDESVAKIDLRDRCAQIDGSSPCWDKPKAVVEAWASLRRAANLSLNDLVTGNIDDL